MQWCNSITAHQSVLRLAVEVLYMLTMELLFETRQNRRGMIKGSEYRSKLESIEVAI